MNVGKLSSGGGRAHSVDQENLGLSRGESREEPRVTLISGKITDYVSRRSRFSAPVSTSGDPRTTSTLKTPDATLCARRQAFWGRV